jgi:hypothetical protein
LDGILVIECFALHAEWNSNMRGVTHPMKGKAFQQCCNDPRLLMKCLAPTFAFFAKRNSIMLGAISSDNARHGTGT